MTADNVAVIADGLSMLYKSHSGDKMAVNDISLTISQGTRLGLIGRNGAGKSTFLQMIAGLAQPTAGRITVNGKVTAVMTLGVGLREDLSGRDNIFIDGEIQGKARHEIEDSLDSVIEFADLGAFIDYPVRTYSTGMKARLAFAMITHIDPEILVIDEALSAGDAKFGAKASAKIRELCSRGRIAIVVSHSMAAIRDICNRCVWLEDGRVMRDGDPVTVTNAYLEAVRQEDESSLLDKFRNLAHSRTVIDGHAVRWLELLDEESNAVKAAVECGINVRLRAGGVIPAGGKMLALRLQIWRLDGLRVIDERRDFIGWQTSSGGGDFLIEIGMRPLVLSQGIYRATLQIMAQAEIAAERSTVFEAYTNSPPIGGRTALMYQATLEQQPALPEGSPS